MSIKTAQTGGCSNVTWSYPSIPMHWYFHNNMSYQVISITDSQNGKQAQLFGPDATNARRQNHQISRSCDWSPLLTFSSFLKISFLKGPLRPWHTKPMVNQCLAVPDRWSTYCSVYSSLVKPLVKPSLMTWPI